MSNEPISGYIKGPNGDDIRTYLRGLSEEDRDKLQRSAVYVEPNFEIEEVTKFLEAFKAMLDDKENPFDARKHKELASAFGAFLLEKIVASKEMRSFVVDECLLRDPHIAKFLTKQNVNIIRKGCIEVLANVDFWPTGMQAEPRIETFLESAPAMHFDDSGTLENALMAVFSLEKSTQVLAGLLEIDRAGPTKIFNGIHFKEGDPLANLIEANFGSLMLITNKSAHRRPDLIQEDLGEDGTRKFFRKGWNLNNIAGALIKAIENGVDENFAENFRNELLSSIHIANQRPKTPVIPSDLDI